MPHDAGRSDDTGRPGDTGHDDTGHDDTARVADRAESDRAESDRAEPARTRPDHAAIRAADRAAHRRALESAAFGRDDAAADSAREELARLDSRGRHGDAIRRSDRDVAPVRPGRRGGLLLAAVVAAVALVVGLGAGILAGRSLPATAAATPVPTGSDLQNALARSPSEADLLPDEVRGDVERSTSRLAATLTLADEPGGDSLKVFVARGTRRSEVCVVVVPEGGSPSTLCLARRIALTQRVVLSSAGPPLVPSSIVLDRGDIRAEFA